MPESVSKRQKALQLQAAREAARLFLANGVGATSGKDIAAAAGMSERTFWRYFRTKESCLAPLFSVSWTMLAKELSLWPHDMSLEDCMARHSDLSRKTAEEISDGLLVVRLIAALPEEPELRSVWLLSYHESEDALCAIIGGRLGRAAGDFEVRLCAAAVMGAVRIIDETISTAVLRYGQTFDAGEIAARTAAAIRAVASLPFCDPVAPNPFGGQPDPKATKKVE